MSRPLYVLGAGCLFSTLIGLVLLLGILWDSRATIAVAAWLLGSAILLVQLDSWRRTRSLRNYVRDQFRDAPRVPDRTTSSPLPARTSTDDVAGVVRVMQAQYVGRLDRLQSAVEETLASVRSRDDERSPLV